MDLPTLKAQWLQEESTAHIQGWDFSHLEGRWHCDEDLPWDYRTIVQSYRHPEHRLLDLDTGGGEFLLSLGHPHKNTAATEAYPPNAALCQEVLLPLGIDFRKAPAAGPLPWTDDTFDLILNRHGAFDPQALFRVLKPGGLFVTQQVGAYNDRALVDLLLPGIPLPFPDNTLDKVSARFRDTGFAILESGEVFRPIRFFDVGALVWFARIIEWEFPGFSVDACLPRLCEAQAILEERGSIDGQIHRFYLAAKKL